MATKRLSRSIVEGGRGNVYERRESNWKLRSDTRIYLYEVQNDDADGIPHPRRQPVRAEFTDKLNPLRRFLDAHVGQRWDDVQSKLRAQLDDRSVSGRHVIYGHLYPMVEGMRFWPADYPVENGILTKTIRRTWHRRKDKPKERFTYRSLEGVRAWLKGRRVVEHQGKLYWLLLKQEGFVKCFLDHRHPADGGNCTREGQRHRTENGTPYMTHWVVVPERRDRKLNEHELRYWKTLDPRLKARILKFEQV